MSEDFVFLMFIIPLLIGFIITVIYAIWLMKDFEQRMAEKED